MHEQHITFLPLYFTHTQVLKNLFYFQVEISRHVFLFNFFVYKYFLSLVLIFSRPPPFSSCLIYLCWSLPISSVFLAVNVLLQGQVCRFFKHLNQVNRLEDNFLPAHRKRSHSVLSLGLETLTTKRTCPFCRQSKTVFSPPLSPKTQLSNFLKIQEVFIPYVYF